MKIKASINRISRSSIETKSLESVAQTLEALNWDFHEEATKLPIHYIHPYPAKFIGALPRELIRILHPGGDGYVLDPFCGCGTTLVESALAGFPAIGIDLHPLATLIARVKTTPLHQKLLPLARKIIEQVSSRRTQYKIPAIPNLDHWFYPEIQHVLAGLIHEIDKVSEIDERDALRVAFSNIVIRVSLQESDTRYAAIDKQVDADMTYKLFLKATDKIDAALAQAYGELFSTRPRVRTINADILKVTSKDVPEKISLIVTSPPYPNAYEYWLYHKYRMYWLGMDPIFVRTHEIGARAHYFKKNAPTADDFARQMHDCLSLFHGILHDGAFACIIIGRSIIHGTVVDNAALIAAEAKKVGFTPVTRLSRAIPKYKKAFNPKTSQINSEDLLVFAK